MEEFFTGFYETIAMVEKNVPLVLGFIGILWAIHLLNWSLRYHLNLLGIYPRSWHGLLGIAFSPFLHGNFEHLFFNSIPLFALANFVLLSGLQAAIAISLIIIVLSGFATWLLGRRALHVGASGLIMGYMGYLLVNVYHEPSAISVVLGAVILYYFGILLAGLLPTKLQVSWEGHLFGFLAGIAAHYLWPLVVAYQL